MAKKSDSRIDKFREEGMAFITEHFHDMKEAFEGYIQEKNWDKAVALYFKLVDKVIPALPTQATETAPTEKPAWLQKIENMKKTQEK